MITDELNKIIEHKKEQCQYRKAYSCNNCKKFVDLAGHGFRFSCCDDERNDIIPNQHRLPVESNGCCNYWEPSSGSFKEVLEHRNINDHK